MKKKDNLRGWPIYRDCTGAFRFCDTDERTVTTWFDRPCGLCGKYGSSHDNLPDPCLGWLPGVTNACCGHGDREKSYVCFENGVILRGFFVAATEKPKEKED